jgi:accessory gene regulator B
MERLAKKIAESVGVSLGKSEEEIAVMAYGWIGIIQFSAIFLLSSVFGILFGFWLEVFTVFLSVGFLRRMTGGAHSAGIYQCLFYSVVFVVGISAVSAYALPRLSPVVNWILCGLIFVFGYVTVALKAPVTPPNKPCRSEKKRKRLRKGSFIVLTLFLVIVFLLVVPGRHVAKCYSMGLALALSTLWQISMMTRAGHWFISLLDGVFSRKEREN